MSGWSLTNAWTLANKAFATPGAGPGGDESKRESSILRAGAGPARRPCPVARPRRWSDLGHVALRHEIAEGSPPTRVRAVPCSMDRDGDRCPGDAVTRPPRRRPGRRAPTVMHAAGCTARPRRPVAPGSAPKARPGGKARPPPRGRRRHPLPTYAGKAWPWTSADRTSERVFTCASSYGRRSPPPVVALIGAADPRILGKPDTWRWPRS